MSELPVSLEGTNALVTGGSSGLGPAIVAALDRAGARLAVHYHSNREGADALAQGLSSRPALLQADLGDTRQVVSLFEKARSALGSVNLLVNCAATESQSIADLVDIDHGRWQTTQRTNVDAPMLLMQQFARQQQPGCIVNISSIEASRPAAAHGHYAVSKAALEMLTRSAALEYGSLDIRVNAIAPGLIWREGIESGWPEGVESWRSAAPLDRLVEPGHIADTVLFLASDSARSMTGTVLTVDCGLSVRSGW